MDLDMRISKTFKEDPLFITGKNVVIHINTNDKRILDFFYDILDEEFFENLEKVLENDVSN